MIRLRFIICSWTRPLMRVSLACFEKNPSELEGQRFFAA